MTSDLERRRMARAMWRYVGDERPPFAAAPAAGQESVWDYPRPPSLMADARLVTVANGNIVIAHSTRSLRLLETASPPTFYLPPEDVRRDLLVPAAGASHCEWKGTARYWALASNSGEPVAWTYADPLPPYEALKDHFGFYARKLDCRVDGVPVVPQPGAFYAGWITPELVGPFKGEPGSQGW